MGGYKRDDLKEGFHHRIEISIEGMVVWRSDGREQHNLPKKEGHVQQHRLGGVL